MKTTLELEVEVEIEDAYDCWDGSAPSFVIEAFSESGAYIEDVLDEACDSSIEDIIEWLRNNDRIDSSETIVEFLEYLNDGLDSSEQRIAELLDEIWNNKNHIQYNDVDNIKQLLQSMKVL